MAIQPLNPADYIAATVQKADSNFSDLDTRAASAAADVTALQADVADHETRITNAETNIGLTNGDLLALANRVTSIEQDPDVRRFDYNEAASTGLSFAYYGGRYDDAEGVSHFVADGAVPIVLGNNYIEMDYPSGVISSNASGFTEGALKMWVATSDGTDIVNVTDYRPQEMQPGGGGVSVGFSKNSAGTSSLTYAYRGGIVRSDNVVVDVAAGTVSLTDNATNYVEVSGAGVVSANTVDWTSGSVPLARITTAGGNIISVDDKRGALVATTASSNGGGGGFFDAATWMMT
jgi:hypothetical protein